jgi:hypothetical protein
MSYAVSIDPGKLQCGVAIFSEKRLISAILAKNLINKPGEDGPAVWVNTAKAVWEAIVWSGGTNGPTGVIHLCQRIGTLVLEVPVVRKAGLQKGSQDDVLTLAGVDGAIASLLSDMQSNDELVSSCYRHELQVKHYKPEQWKGQAPKAVMCARIMDRLTPDEKKSIDPTVPKSLLSNVHDAIGIGLKYLGRL